MPEALPLAASFLAAFLLSLLVVLLGRRGFGIDAHAGLRRKLHGQPVPRVGGLALMGAAGIGGALSIARDAGVAGAFLGLLGCALPCFAGGLTDDLSAGVHPRARLALMSVSALLALLVLDVRVARIDVEAIDAVLRNPWLGGTLTLLALLTITNGINLIDGLNGLAGGTSLAMFAGLALVAQAVGDPLVLHASLVLAAATAGFLVWNFPGGRLFLGDGGAYLLGFLLGALSVLLVARNPTVSAWFPPLLLAYPLTEVAFSVWRRRVQRSGGVATADAAHLHHLIYRRAVRWRTGSGAIEDRELRNALASIYLWTLSAAAIVPAVLLHAHGAALAGALALFVSAYVWLYARIARLRTPRRMILRGRRAHRTGEGGPNARR